MRGSEYLKQKLKKIQTLVYYETNKSHFSGIFG